MTIAAILKDRDGSVVAVHGGDTLHDVIALLAERRFGAVPVIDGDRLIGIFSERDVVRLIAREGPGVLESRIDRVMTPNPVTVAPRLGVMAALSLMTERRIRHLPVCEGDAVVGFISIGDLVKYRIDKIEAEAAAMRDYIAG